MLPALVSLKGLVKNKSYHIDFPLFRLHYQVTVLLLLTFCLILTAKIMFGDPIDCKSSMTGSSDFSDNVCFAQGTYTTYGRDVTLKEVDFQAADKMVKVPEIVGINKARYSQNVSYLQPGMPIPEAPDATYYEKMWHHYYQYVPIMLFLQSVLFYLPHYLWKSWENGLIASVCKQLHEHRFDPTNFFESNYNLIYYLQNSLLLNKSLVYKYYFCHWFLLLNLGVQILVMDYIFNHQFISYGIDTLWYFFVDKDVYGLRGPNSEMAQLNNPMDFVFPKVTGCTFLALAQGGEQIEQYICVLPLNIIHDKFYLFLWFWLATLLVLTVFQILLDLMTIFLPPFRSWWFKFRFGEYNFEVNSSSKDDSPLPEVFLLSLIGSNSDKYAFSALLKRLSKEDWTASPSENHSLV